MRATLAQLNIHHLDHLVQSGSGSLLEKLYMFAMYDALCDDDEIVLEDIRFKRRGASIIEISGEGDQMFIGRIKQQDDTIYVSASSNDWYPCWIVITFV